MRRKFVSVSVSAALLLAAGSALADHYSGEITKLDRGSRSIEVKGEESQRKLLFFLGRGGEVTRAGQPVDFADLQRGDRVELEFSKRGSTQTALSIAVVGNGQDKEIATRE